MTLSETIDKESVDFAKLPLPDIEPIQAAIRAHIQQQEEMKLDACKVTGIERYVALRDSVPHFIGPDRVNAYLWTPEGVTRVLTKSLTKTGKSGEAITALLAKIDLVTGRDIALRAISFRSMAPPVGTTGKGQPDSTPAP